MSLFKTSLFVASLALLNSCTKSLNDAQLASTVAAGQGEAQSYYDAGKAAQAAGKNSKALKLYKKVTKDYPLTVVAADAQYRQASMLDQKGKLLDAFNAYDGLLDKYPNSPHYSVAIKRQIDLANAAAGGSLRTPTFIGLKARLDPKKTVGMLGKVRDHAPRSPSAVKAQFTIGEVWVNDGKIDSAIPAFQKVVTDYSESPLAPEAQYRIGELLIKEAEEGNQDQANLDRARRAFDDLILRYPGTKRSRDAKRELSKIASGNIERTFNVAEFYRKKGNNASAAYYYSEVVRNSKPGPLHKKAKAWVAQLKN